MSWTQEMEVDISLYCAHAQKGMTAFEYKKVGNSWGFNYHEYVYCVDELTFLRLLNYWNTRYLGKFTFVAERKFTGHAPGGQTAWS